MIVLSKKDIELIETVEILKVMTSSQIQRLFFYHKPNQCRRCKQLVNHKKLKCFKQGLGQENIYYYKRKPVRQLKSMLAVSELYVQLVELGKELNFEVKTFSREYTVQIDETFQIRPDAYFILTKNDKEYDFFVEVDNTKEFSSDKYYRMIKMGKYPPPILSISNRKRIIYDGMDVIKIKLDLSDFKEIFPSCI